MVRDHPAFLLVWQDTLNRKWQWMMKPIIHGNNGILCLKLTKEKEWNHDYGHTYALALIFSFLLGLSWIRNSDRTQKLHLKYKNQTSLNFLHLWTWIKKMICKVFSVNRRPALGESKPLTCGWRFFKTTDSIINKWRNQYSALFLCVLFPSLRTRIGKFSPKHFCKTITPS